MSSLLRREVAAEAKKVEGKDRVRSFVLSTPNPDRYSSTLALDGWDLSNFERNPIALAFHNHYAPPIGRWANVAVRDGALRGELEFFPAEVNPESERLLRMVDMGVMAVSVGFDPKEWSYNEERPSAGWYPAIDYKRQELLECSVVNVPGNAEAMLEGRSFGDARFILPHEALERRRAPAPPQVETFTAEDLRAVLRSALNPISPEKKTP